MKQTHMFKCLLCKKKRGYDQLEMLFDDGSPMCKLCGDEIRGSFYYYDLKGNEISKTEFDKITKKKDEGNNEEKL